MTADTIIERLRALPVVKHNEIDGEESDGTPRYWRDRPFVSLRQSERIINEALGHQSRAAADVLAERRRQREVEGWTDKHDDEHQTGGMTFAAAAYAVHAHAGTSMSSALWRWTGWATNWFKPKDTRRDLVRAAALLLAEIERIDRAEVRKGADQHG